MSRITYHLSEDERHLAHKEAQAEALTWARQASEEGGGVAMRMASMWAHVADALRREAL
jgi:hypothetical protein